MNELAKKYHDTLASLMTRFENAPTDKEKREFITKLLSRSALKALAKEEITFEKMLETPPARDIECVEPGTGPDVITPFTLAIALGDVASVKRMLPFIEKDSLNEPALFHLPDDYTYLNVASHPHILGVPHAFKAESDFVNAQIEMIKLLTDHGAQPILSGRRHSALNAGSVYKYTWGSEESANQIRAALLLAGDRPLELCSPLLNQPSCSTAPILPHAAEQYLSSSNEDRKKANERMNPAFKHDLQQYMQQGMDALLIPAPGLEENSMDGSSAHMQLSEPSYQGTLQGNVALFQLLTRWLSKHFPWNQKRPFTESDEQALGDLHASVTKLGENLKILSKATLSHYDETRTELFKAKSDFYSLRADIWEIQGETTTTDAQLNDLQQRHSHLANKLADLHSLEDQLFKLEFEAVKLSRAGKQLEVCYDPARATLSTRVVAQSDRRNRPNPYLPFGPFDAYRGGGLGFFCPPQATKAAAAPVLVESIRLPRQ